MDEKEKKLIIRALESYWENHMDPTYPDNKYDFLIPIKYNYHKPKLGKGSAIFIHLTKNYKPTA